MTPQQLFHACEQNATILWILRPANKLMMPKMVSNIFVQVVRKDPSPIHQFSKVPFPKLWSWYESWKGHFYWHRGLTDDEVLPLWRLQCGTRYCDHMRNIQNRLVDRSERVDRSSPTSCICTRTPRLVIDSLLSIRGPYTFSISMGSYFHRGCRHLSRSPLNWTVEEAFLQAAGRVRPNCSFFGLCSLGSQIYPGVPRTSRVLADREDRTRLHNRVQQLKEQLTHEVPYFHR